MGAYVNECGVGITSFFYHIYKYVPFLVLLLDRKEKCWRMVPDRAVHGTNLGG